MILVDTSVWVDFFRQKETPEADYLSAVFEKDQDICVCGVIMTELLQGVRNQAESDAVSQSLESLVYLPMPRKVYYLAADIYRQARTGGEVIRNTIDCLIAACAIVHRTPLLQSDKDYRVISKYSKLKLAEVV